MSRNQDRLGGVQQPDTSPPPQQGGGGFSFVIPTEFVDLPSLGRFYAQNHPLHGKDSIEIKQMTAKEEDILTSRTLLKKGVALERLLQSIIVDKTIDPKTLLIGDRNAIIVAARVSGYGNDYSTKDGTGIRDYIHVSDLASAHLKAIHYLKDNNKNLILNLGTGEGHSVLDVIKRTEVISGNNIKYEFQKRRKGDPDSVIADAKNAFSFLNWEPKSSDLDTIIKSTWGMYSRLENVDRNG